MRPAASSRKILALAVAAAVAAMGACAPTATPPPEDDMATTVARFAFDMFTQTAAAASPTPTATLTPNPTATPTVTPTGSDAGRLPLTLSYAACWFGPGPAFRLDSNISKGKGVELLGIGTVPGWYIVRNPYFHSPCWLQASDLKIFEGTDLTKYPVMTPGGP
jgi:hypothetical protein